MRIAKISLVALAMLLIVSCNKNKVNLLETNAKAEVPSLGNLTFTFDKNLVGDSLLNQWDTTEYIEFSPKIPGRFRWENANELVFSPEAELPPAVSFTGNVTNRILLHSQKLSLGKCEKLSFHTPYLQLQSSNAMWNVSDGNAGNAFPQIDLYFNYRVNPALLKDLLSINVDGAKVNYNIQTTTPDTKISVTLMGFKVEDKDLVAKLKIEKGLLPERGTNPTDQAIEATLVITSPYNMTVQNVESDHDGTQGNVKVLMSQSPVSEGLEKFISFDPKVNFKAEVTSEGMVITSEEFDVAKSYTLKLNEGMKGRIGGTLK
ncbi:MAG: hypothetical protein KA149_07360, partial [Chitinophagales bacterium]|nr:hypothetical protein [Chitinophagales bacterium]